MKATLLLLVSIICFANLCEAQHKKPDRIFKKGQSDVQIGVGLVPTYFMDKAKMIVPPVSLEFNHLLSDHFSLGAYAGHSVSQSKPGITSDGIPQSVQNKHFQFGLKGGIHITKWDNFDWYGGFMLAYNHSKFKAVDNSDMQFMEQHLGIERKKEKFTYTGFLGVRYAFEPKYTLFGEAGFGVSLLTVGVSRKI